MGCSAFADHAVVSRHSLVKIDREVPLEEGLPHPAATFAIPQTHLVAEERAGFERLREGKAIRQVVVF